MLKQFLALFSLMIERRPNVGAVRSGMTAETIGATFTRDALRQQRESFYFHKGLAAPKTGLRKYLECDDWLKN